MLGSLPLPLHSLATVSTASAVLTRPCQQQEEGPEGAGQGGDDSGDEEPLAVARAGALEEPSSKHTLQVRAVVHLWCACMPGQALWWRVCARNAV